MVAKVLDVVELSARRVIEGPLSVEAEVCLTHQSSNVTSTWKFKRGPHREKIIVIIKVKVTELSAELNIHMVHRE